MSFEKIRMLKSRVELFFGKKHTGTIVSFPKSGRTWLIVMLDQLDVKMVTTHAGSEYIISSHHSDLPRPNARARAPASNYSY
jgi:hypothetical protein